MTSLTASARASESHSEVIGWKGFRLDTGRLKHPDQLITVKMLCKHREMVAVQRQQRGAQDIAAHAEMALQGLDQLVEVDHRRSPLLPTLKAHQTDERFTVDQTPAPRNREKEIDILPLACNYRRRHLLA